MWREIENHHAATQEVARAYASHLFTKSMLPLKALAELKFFFHKAGAQIEALQERADELRERRFKYRPKRKRAAAKKGVAT